MSDDRVNELFECTTSLFRSLHFGVTDMVRRMQGDALELLGYGPSECPYDVVASGSFWRLRDYGRAQPSRAVLIVAAPIKRPYIWDLSPATSAIRYCLKMGLQVRLLEWLPASPETCSVGIAECAGAIAASLDRIAAERNGSKPIVMGHSLGGTLAAIHAATAQDSISGLVLLGAPVCFEKDESPFRDALVSLVPAPVPESQPFPGSVLSHASAAASPETFIWSRLIDAIQSSADSEAMNLHARVERWALDEVPLPGKLVSDIVDGLYRENRFCRGMLSVGARTVGPRDLAVPVLAVVNSADAVAPMASIKPFGDALGPARFQIIEYPGEPGVCLQHLGVLVGRQAFQQVWPAIIDWINART
jgi:polyhydroxyalkanoate synthase